MYDPITGKVRIIDFGTATLTNDNSRSKGTLGYMSPQMRDKPTEHITITEKHDVYALGVTLKDLFGISYDVIIRSDNNYRVIETRYGSEAAMRAYRQLESPQKEMLDDLIDGMTRTLEDQRLDLQHAIDVLKKHVESEHTKTIQQEDTQELRKVGNDFVRAFFLESPVSYDEKTGHYEVKVPAVMERREDGFCICCTNQEIASQIAKALYLGEIIHNNKPTAYNNKYELNLTKEQFEKLRTFSSDKISLLMRLSEKYNAINPASTKKIDVDKREVLQVAARYLTGQATLEELNSAKAKEQSKWKSAFFSSKTVNLITAVNNVMVNHEPLDSNLVIPQRKKSLF